MGSQSPNHSNSRTKATRQSPEKSSNPNLWASRVRKVKTAPSGPLYLHNTHVPAPPKQKPPAPPASVSSSSVSSDSVTEAPSPRTKQTPKSMKKPTAPSVTSSASSAAVATTP